MDDKVPETPKLCSHDTIASAAGISVCLDCGEAAVMWRRVTEAGPSPKRARRGQAMTATMDNVRELLLKINRYIDDHPANAARDPEARTWGRLAKVAKELGETIGAFIGATDQNPRKGVTHTLDDVRTELLDVALTAITAWIHMSCEGSDPLAAFAEHVAARAERIGITR